MASRGPRGWCPFLPAFLPPAVRRGSGAAARGGMCNFHHREAWERSETFAVAPAGRFVTERAGARPRAQVQQVGDGHRGAGRVREPREPCNGTGGR